MIVENDEKKHCPSCKSKEVKLNGKTKQGKQRYRCLSCKKTYIWKQNKCIEERRYSWFTEWILEGLTVRQISRMKKVSSSTVNRVINYWLKKQPPKLKDLEEIKYIILDGTYINHRTGLYVIMDGAKRKIIYGEYGINETGKYLKTFYNRLQKEGLNPISATIDGSLQQLKYLKESWNNIIIQRCLVHIQRHVLPPIGRHTKKLLN